MANIKGAAAALTKKTYSELKNSADNAVRIHEREVKYAPDEVNSAVSDFKSVSKQTGKAATKGAKKTADFTKKRVENQLRKTVKKRFEKAAEKQGKSALKSANKTIKSSERTVKSVNQTVKSAQAAEKVTVKSTEAAAKVTVKSTEATAKVGEKGAEVAAKASAKAAEVTAQAAAKGAEITAQAAAKGAQATAKVLQEAAAVISKIIAAAAKALADLLEALEVILAAAAPIIILVLLVVLVMCLLTGDTAQGIYDEQNAEMADMVEAENGVWDLYQEIIESVNSDWSSQLNSLSSGSTSTTINGSFTGQDVIDYGLQYLGAPYKLGGYSWTDGIDCSGFVKKVYEHFDVYLPHQSTKIRKYGTAVEPVESEMLPGDIICYYGHVGLYYGDGKVLHASGSGSVKIGDNWKYRSVWGVRRIFGSGSSSSTSVSGSTTSWKEIIAIVRGAQLAADQSGSSLDNSYLCKLFWYMHSFTSTTYVTISGDTVPNGSVQEKMKTVQSTFSYNSSSYTASAERSDTTTYKNSKSISSLMDAYRTYDEETGEETSNLSYTTSVIITINTKSTKEGIKWILSEAGSSVNTDENYDLVVDFIEIMTSSDMDELWEELLPGVSLEILFGNAGSYIYTGEDFLWPLPSPYGADHVSSGYGYRTGAYSGFHEGIDIWCPAGTPIYAVLDGTVVSTYYSDSAGNYTIIDHGDGLYTEYMHQTSFAVSPGQSVKQGQIIGYVGSTGWSTGSHLHIGVMVGGNGSSYRVDPGPYLGLY